MVGEIVWKRDIPLNYRDISRGLAIPELFTEDLAYLSGILVGDGSIYQRKDKHDFILKCVGNPEDEQELYTAVIGPKFKNVFGFVPTFGLQDSTTT